MNFHLDSACTYGLRASLLVCALFAGVSLFSACKKEANPGMQHDPLVHRFEHASDWTGQLDAPDRVAWQKPAELVAFMNITPGMKVADIGAGTGYFLPYLSRAVGENGEVLGLDIEPDMVRHMKERAEREGLQNVTPRLVDGDNPGLADHSVDRVLIVDTWHHIPDRERYAARLARVLAPGGAVYLVDYTMTSPHGPPGAHRIAPDAAAKEMASAGLLTEIDTDILPEQYVVIARAP